MLARDKIRRLSERYALAVDGKDLDGIAALFVEEVDNGRYGPGREGVKNFYDRALRNFHCSMHLVANHVIDFDDDDHAHGVVYCRGSTTCSNRSTGSAEARFADARTFPTFEPFWTRAGST